MRRRGRKGNNSERVSDSAEKKVEKRKEKNEEKRIVNIYRLIVINCYNLKNIKN